MCVMRGVTRTRTMDGEGRERDEEEGGREGGR